MAKGDNLIGDYWVRLFGPAMWDAKKRWPRAKDRMELRRHALKLRFWPQSRPHDCDAPILDMDWEWIKALKGKHIGELRIDDRIGGHENIRLIFFVGDRRQEDRLPIVWILASMVKKRTEFTKNDIKTFERYNRFLWMA